MNLVRVFVSAALISFPVSSTSASSQSSVKSSPKQRISFGMEDEPFPNQVAAPEAARSLIANDDDVRRVLDYAELAPSELPQNWLQCSEIRLSPEGKPDLLVMGVNQLLGANVTSFWILRRSGDGYEIALKTAALGLTILPTRTNGLFDIETGAATANRYSINRYIYAEHVYELSKQVSAPMGEEVPTDFRMYTARKSVVLSSTAVKDPEKALSQARDWFWENWWLEKPAYLKLTLFSKEGDETSDLYLIDKSDSGGISVEIVHRRIEVDRVPHPGPRRNVERVNIEIATDIERHPAQATRENPGVELSEGLEPPASGYKLVFHDDFGEILHIL